MDQAKDRTQPEGPASAARAPEPLPPHPGTTRDRRAPRGVPSVVARIREDARVDPGRYLEECEVPGGGE